MAFLYASTPNNITLAVADFPYLEFSSPIDIITDAADTPFDATIDSDGNILLTYIGVTAGDLRFVRLDFAGGSWSAGTPITVYSSDECSYPHIFKFSTGTLWLTFTRYSSGAYYLSAKASGDNGDTWSPESDPGKTLTSGNSQQVYGLMVESGLTSYVFYSEGGSKIAYRSLPDSVVLWNSEVVLATEGGYDEQINAAVAADGRIGLTYISSSGLKFREYSGSAWSGENSLESGSVFWPEVKYQDGEAYVIYACETASGLLESRYVRTQDGQFGSAVVLDDRRSALSAVLVYSSSAGSYEDKTVEAASDDSADVIHSVSGALLSLTDDAVYIGLDQPFNFVHINLATTGSGGQVSWKYFDGQVWQTFSPSGGDWHFSASSRDVLLWDDYQSIPSDWQKNTISGGSRYWIAIVTTTSFSTAPVGTRLTAIANTGAMIQGR